MYMYACGWVTNINEFNFIIQFSSSSDKHMELGDLKQLISCTFPTYHISAVLRFARYVLLYKHLSYRL